MEKAIFLDRDGTINIDFGYVHSKEQLQFLPGVVEGLKALQKRGFLLVIITNQSGIARGYFSEKEYLQFEQELESQLRDEGVYINGTYYCPHLDGRCNCRKPKTGLFYQAQRDLNIDFACSYAIGDNERDLCICKEQPVKGYLIHMPDYGMLDISKAIINDFEMRMAKND